MIVDLKIVFTKNKNTGFTSENQLKINAVNKNATILRLTNLLKTNYVSSCAGAVAKRNLKKIKNTYEFSPGKPAKNLWAKCTVAS